MNKIEFEDFLKDKGLSRYLVIEDNTYIEFYLPGSWKKLQAIAEELFPLVKKT